MKVELKVNGKAVTADVPPNTLLVQLLREHLRLTGTHVGCDTGQCGACTVIADGSAIKACNVLAAQMQGAEVTTIEGLAAADGTLHPMQAAFKECHGLQCGFCTPGMVMSSVAPPAGQRGRDPRPAGRQPVPLHGLPEHRQGGADRPEGHGRLTAPPRRQDHGCQ